MTFVERLRDFEQSLQRHMKDVVCPVHLCLGQEHVPDVLHRELREDDWVFSTHRSHGHALAKGVSEQKIWDEIMGLATGINGGFSGSQSFSAPEQNFHCSAIVGGLVGVATGAAYALHANGSDAIVVCCIGDAGTEQGVFWESLNFAALYRLPIAFICENNGMSVDAEIHERQATLIPPRVSAFGVQIMHTVEAAIRTARSGIPCFVEVKAELQCDHINMAALLPTEIL